MQGGGTGQLATTTRSMLLPPLHTHLSRKGLRLAIKRAIHTSSRRATALTTQEASGEGGSNSTTFLKGQTPKSGIPPNVAPKIVTPENYLQIWDSSVTLIGQLAIVTLLGAIIGGMPLSGPYPFKNDNYLSFRIRYPCWQGMVARTDGTRPQR